MIKQLSSIHPKVIYILVALSLSIPLLSGYSVPPARMDDAQRFFKLVDELPVQDDRYAFVALDFGPNTQAENASQANVIVEHLFRRRIPVLMFSVYVQAEPFLSSIPEQIKARLEQEHPGQRWNYGEDWLNLGYRPGFAAFLQNIPKSKNLLELFDKDVRGVRLQEYPAFANFITLDNIGILTQFTGLSSVFDLYIQFMKKSVDQPPFGHGCTSITIPEAFIYLDSGQIKGLLGGIGGAAYYSKLLSDKYPNRPVDDAQVLNTGLGVAHLVVILLIILGNLGYFLDKLGK